MPLRTCVLRPRCDNRRVVRSLHTRASELAVAWCVAGAVVATGIYDFSTGEPAEALIDLDPTLGLALFVVACAATALLASVRTLRHSAHNGLALALALCGVAPAWLSDPTYASLMVAIPLIDIRRREAEPARTLRALALLGVVGFALVAEDTPRLLNEIEAMLGLCTTLLLVVLLGDGLRKLDEAVIIEAQLATLNERTRMAEELHDSLGHHLLAASVQLKNVDAFRTRDPERSAAAIEHASQAIADALAETRLIVDATRTEQDWHIEPSIRELADRIVPARTHMSIQIAGDHDALQPTTQLAIYRMVQEGLTNLVRHSSATVASIASRADEGKVTVEIADNGVGITDAAQLRGGLVTMRRRIEGLGGTFAIESTSAGTAIKAVVPR